MTMTEFEHSFTQQSQYSKDVIQTFELTFGKHYMSAGGDETSRKTAALLLPVLQRHNHHTSSSSAAPRVLEVGCGIGGASFFLANEFGAVVHGVDINPVGISMAQQTLQERPLENGAVRFEVLDVTAVDFPAASYDIIYSRDALLHLSNETKKELFARFHKWLTPGGMVCITDYCLGQKSAIKISPDFQLYLDARGYHLLSPQGYKDIAVGAGFEEDHVRADDHGLWYCQVSQLEIDRVGHGSGRDEFLKTKTVQELDKLVKVYQDKIQMTLRGDRSYVILHATKTPAYYTKRQEIVQAYATLANKGYIMSCDGNVSCRAGDGTFLVTPSGVMIPDLTADKVVLCQLSSGKAVPGETFKPSSESGLHNCIYRARPDVGGIVHTHSIFVCALACCRLPLPPAHYAVCELLQKFDFSDPNGGSTTTNSNGLVPDATVKCASYHNYGSHALSLASVKGLGKNYAVLLANHGAVVVGSDLASAMYLAERLERECEIYWRCLQMQSAGPPQPLNMKDIQELQQADKTYGQDHPDKTVDDETTPDLALASGSDSDES